jgi:hypothetical protein
MIYPPKYSFLGQNQQIPKVEKNEYEELKQPRGIKNNIVTSISLIFFASLMALSIRFGESMINNIPESCLYLILIIALGMSFLMGLMIITTLGNYLKRLITAIKKSKSEIRIFSNFDIFVIIAFVIAFRNVVGHILSYELLPQINFIFSYTPPDWILNVLIWLGYRLDLTILENFDLFFAHNLCQALSCGMVTWTLFRNGFKIITKPIIIPKKESNWTILLCGTVCSICLILMKISNWDKLLIIFNYYGVIFGTLLFIGISYQELANKGGKVVFVYILYILPTTYIGSLLFDLSIVGSIIWSIFGIGGFFLIRHFIDQNTGRKRKEIREKKKKWSGRNAKDIWNAWKTRIREYKRSVPKNWNAWKKGIAKRKRSVQKNWFAWKIRKAEKKHEGTN